MMLKALMVVVALTTIAAGYSTIAATQLQAQLDAVQSEVRDLRNWVRSYERHETLKRVMQRLSPTEEERLIPAARPSDS